MDTEQIRSDDRTDEIDSSPAGSGSPTFDRRTCLQLAGAAVASTAGCIGNEDLTGAAESGSTGVAPVGYGGAPALPQYLSPDRLSTGSEGYSIDPPSASEVVRLGTDDRTASRLSSGTDWYAFDATGVSDLTIKYDRADARGISGFALYDTEGKLVDQAYVAGDRPVYLPASPADGTHYLQVSDVSEGTGDYALSLSTDATTTAEQSPYEGTVSSLPGRVQAENFDVGGEDVAYHDTSEENKYDTSYRDSSVDIRETKDDNGAYNIGYFQRGEWLEYTVDPSPGTYDLHLRLATARSNRSLELSLDGETLTTVDVPNTGGWRQWETVTVEDVTIADEGQQVLRVEALNSGIDFNWIEFEGINLKGPFDGTPAGIPGRIQAEDYDTGGEGFGFHDTTKENKYDTSYRDTAVDIRETKDDNGAYNIGYFEEGEWLEYTVDPSPGTYELRVRVASAWSGRQLAVSLGGQQLATLDVPNTGGWRQWETVTVSGISVDSDEKQILRLEALKSGIDLNWVEFVATTSTPTDDNDDFGEYGYGAGGYGGTS